jgi:electron transfer flavoprotein beta subunit
VIEGKKVLAERDIEGGREVVECELPAVITAQKGLNEPRYANLKGIMAAKKKPLEQVSFEDVPVGAVVEAVIVPPARKEGRILGEGSAAVTALVDALKNEVKIF